MHNSAIYMNKANRDARARELKAQGIAGVVKRSIRNQLLHPMYVADYEKETGHVLTAADKGFGNTIYRTHFKSLYEVQWGIY